MVRVEVRLESGQEPGFGQREGRDQKRSKFKKTKTTSNQHNLIQEWLKFRSLTATKAYTCNDQKCWLKGSLKRGKFFLKS